jgi:regulator of sigma E protease
MQEFLQSTLLNIVSFVLVLSLVVTIHELGHFWAARWLGIAVDRFAIGFGRPLLRRVDRSGVEWRVGWLPLGGYVRFSGDAEASSTVPDAESLDEMRDRIRRIEGEGAERRYFHFKPIWARAIVVAAGPFANFILAIVLFAALLLSFGEMLLLPRVGGVVENSAASQAGFRAGDLIRTADGRAINDFRDLQVYVSLRADQPITFTVDRSGAPLTIVATPRRTEQVDPVSGSTTRLGALGIRNSTDKADLVRRHYNPAEALVGGVTKSWTVLDTTLTYIGRIVRGQESADLLRGPLGIARTSGAVAKAGAEGAPDLASAVFGSGVNLISLAAVLSVSIGFMNLLPLPVLDGGHLLFYAYEAIARRPLGARVQAAGYRVGLALLLGLMLFATWNDLQQLRVFKLIGGLFS